MSITADKKPTRWIVQLENGWLDIENIVEEREDAFYFGARVITHNKAGKIIKDDVSWNAKWNKSISIRKNKNG